MNRNMMIAIAAVVILLIGGFLLINRSNDPESVLDNDNDDISEKQQQTTAPEASIGESTSSGDTTSTNGAVKEFTVSGSPFKFDPATLTVSKGDTVKITFKNLNGTHDFVIDELNVKIKTLQTGGQEVVEFTASEAGSFEYYCSVGNHRQMGMKGTLVVK